MTFWTDPNIQPLKKYQFRITIGEVMWYAKTVTLPSFEVGNESYQLVNQKFKYPGLVTWNDITISLVETGKSSFLLRQFLTQAGYSCPGECVNLSGLSKDKFSNARPIIIEQLKPDGNAFQYWEITNWMLSSAKFGDMSYETDEILSVEMSIAYDCAYLKTGSILRGNTDKKAEIKKAEKKDDNTIAIINEAERNVDRSLAAFNSPEPVDELIQKLKQPLPPAGVTTYQLRGQTDTTGQADK